jgi:pantoate--beta-alanine ligase
MDIVQLKEWVINSINFDPALSVEYFDIVDDTSLIPIESWHDKSGKIGCIAVKIGSVRLIDNIRYNS